MIYKTHIAFANAVALAPIAALATKGIYFKPELIGILVAGLTIGATFPDIDEPKSMIGRKFIGVSDLIHAIFGHRGMTHYFMVPIIMAILLAIFPFENINLFVGAVGFIAGYFLHILGDSMTKGGIDRAFFPIWGGTFGLFPKKYRFYTGASIELLIILPLCIIALVGELYLLAGNGQIANFLQKLF